MGKITILPRNRLDWHGQMADNAGLSHVAFRVGVKIGSYFNNKTGKTFVGYERIASDLQLGRSTVAAAIKELKDRGHLEVCSGGGRCVANEYRMILKTAQDVGRYDGGETVQNDALNRPPDRTTTLKLPTEANSTRGKSKKIRHQHGRQEAAEGSKGRAVFKIGSDNWKAWLEYYRAAGHRARVSVMLNAVDTSRYGEWSEVSEWPPVALRRVEAAE